MPVLTRALVRCYSRRVHGPQRGHRRRNRSVYNDPGTAAWLRSSRLRSLSFADKPRLPGGVGLSRARPAPPRPAFCAADAPHEHLHVHPRALPGRNSSDACTSHVPAELKFKRALTALARAAAARGQLMRWNCSVRCHGGRLCCRRCCCCCCCCCGCCGCWCAAAAHRHRDWTTIQPLSDTPPGLGRRGSSTMYCGGGGGGGVVGRSSNDGCPWLAGAAGSSGMVGRGVPDVRTRGWGALRCRGSRWR